MKYATPLLLKLEQIKYFVKATSKNFVTNYVLGNNIAWGEEYILNSKSVVNYYKGMCYENTIKDFNEGWFERVKQSIIERHKNLKRTIFSLYP